MGKYFNPQPEGTLSSTFLLSYAHPFDLRDVVSTFDDLLDVATFDYAVYETMKVLVMDECCMYQLISSPDADEGLRKDGIVNQFKEDKNQNKKLWKRLTIETINANNDNDAAGALTRAKNNLVNGALIYIANDITLDDTTIQKSGLYFCQNVDGDGVLTMAGGGELEAGAVTTDKIGNSAVTEKKIGADAVTREKIANGAVNADKLDTGFLNSLATKDQYDALTAGMVVGENQDPTIANAINYAIHNVLAKPL